MRHKLIIISLLFSLTIGCSSSTSQNLPQTPAEPPAASQAATQQNNTPPPPPPPPESFNTAKQKPVETPPKSPSEPVSPTPGPGMELKKAELGVGDKGRGYSPGIITTPIATYFGVQERLVFEVQIPKAMQLFKAMENRPPKDQEEFMKKIIKENSIKLPSLPLGHRYIYDPKAEQLMVEEPK